MLAKPVGLVLKPQGECLGGTPWQHIQQPAGPGGAGDGGGDINDDGHKIRRAAWGVSVFPFMLVHPNDVHIV